MPLSGAAKNLQTTTGIVNVGLAAAPSANQVLTATSATAATWQTPSGGGDKVVTVSALGPGSGLFNGTFQDWNTGQPTWVFADSADKNLSVQVKVPASCTSISSIKVFYINANVGSTNLYVRYYTSHSPIQTSGGTYQNDQTDTFTATASGATQFKLYALTVPAGAYNDLSGIVAGSLIGINIDRDATNGADTYNAAWNVCAVEFTFA